LPRTQEIVQLFFIAIQRPPFCDSQNLEGCHISGNATNSLLKKASEHAIANAIKNSSSPKANKKRDSMSQRTSK
jgi:hypothetical protein